MELKAIGIIHSPYQSLDQAPKMGSQSSELFQLEIYPDYLDGIADIEDGDQLDVIHWGSQSDRRRLIAHPPHLDYSVGVFSSRSPHRPNPILINRVEVIEKRTDGLVVNGLDAIDQTPLIDIKSAVVDH